MSPAEAAALLALAAAFDNRKPDADAATAWAAALDGLRFEDCREAVMGHFRESADWLMPVMVRGRVKRIRRGRIDAFGPLPEPPDGQTSAEFVAWKHDIIRTIGDGHGDQIERPRELAPTDHTARREALLAGAFQEVPGDD